ncbi:MULTISPECIES: hypothetical protein [Streptomyces]|uniref:hypothetical protein n=1 Tax=Streptomyces TaxID=1883 RepID=UPI00345C24F0
MNAHNELYARLLTAGLTSDQADNLLDRHQTELRTIIADELRRAPLPAFPERERASLVTATVQSILVRLARVGPQSDFWRPA